MKTIRKGSDIVVRWRIFRYGQEYDIALYRESISLVLSNMGEKKEITDYSIVDVNTIVFKYRAEDQGLGIYRLLLIDKSRNSTRIIEECNAFRLVNTSDAANNDGTLESAITITLTSELTAPADGLSAYEVALQNGFIGTEEEWLQSLVPDTTDIELAEAQRQAKELERIEAENTRQSAELERQNASTEAVSSANGAATNANNAATTAQQKAEEANTAASAANGAATNANNAATTAQQKAEEANTAASSANAVVEKFNSIIVQETGNSQDKVMSQKAVTDAMTASQAKLSELEGKVRDVKGGVIPLELDGFSKSFLFPTSDGTWTGSLDKKIIIPVKAGEQYILVASDNYALYYSLLKTYDGKETYGDVVDYATSRPIYSAYAGTEATFSIPSDCNFLCIRVLMNTTDTMPKSVSINIGNVGLTKVNNEIEGLKSDINAVKKDVDRLLNYDEILLSMVFGEYLLTDGENKSTDTKRAYCDTYFKVSAEKYKIENSAAYTITLYFYNQDKSLHSVVGWFSAGVTEFTSPVDGYVRLSIGDTNAITLDNYVPLHITRESELNAKLKMAENSITLFNPFIGKSIIHHINVERDSNIGVPSQSLYDIAYAKSLGAMVIEANTQKTSDGVWVIKHGQSGKLGKGLNFGNSGYTANTSFSDANSEVLRSEVSYVSNDVRFNGSHIPTLAEFCAECNRLDMSVLLQVKEKSILDEARKYLPDNRIIAYALPERGDFRGFMSDFVTSSDKDEILKSCLAKGYPYIFSWANYPKADKALVKEVVKALHEYGFLVSTAYLTPNQTLDAKEDGIDMIASTNWISNPESSGNFMELYDGSTSITYESGASYDQSTKTITMPAGSRLYIYNAQVGSMYMNYTLEILYNGKLDISMGNGSVTAQSLNLYYSLLGLQSNGERIIQFSQSNLIGNGTMLLIIAREDTTIKNLHFIASRKM